MLSQTMIAHTRQFFSNDLRFARFAPYLWMSTTAASAADSGTPTATRAIDALAFVGWPELVLPLLRPTFVGVLLPAWGFQHEESKFVV